jgi:hypothetical protein
LFRVSIFGFRISDQQDECTYLADCASAGEIHSHDKYGCHDNYAA